jgi:hypothetical protein
MNENYEQLIADYLQGNLDEEGRKQVDELIASGKIDFIDFRAMEQLYDEMDMVQTPEPSKTMSENFYSMLEQEKADSKPSLSHAISEKLKQLIDYVTMPRLAYAFVLLIVGGFIGAQVGSNDAEIEELTSEMQTMREMMMVSMLEGPSTTDRLRAVNISANLPMADTKAIRALLFTLNNDESVNVRVQTVEALTRWGDNEMVREGLVRSIMNQESDIVIVELADAMVELGVQSSAEEFEKLIEEKDFAPSTREKVQTSIAALL